MSDENKNDKDKLITLASESMKTNKTSLIPLIVVGLFGYFDSRNNIISKLDVMKYEMSSKFTSISTKFSDLEKNIDSMSTKVKSLETALSSQKKYEDRIEKLEENLSRVLIKLKIQEKK